MNIPISNRDFTSITGIRDFSDHSDMLVFIFEFVVLFNFK